MRATSRAGKRLPSGAFVENPHSVNILRDLFRPNVATQGLASGGGNPLFFGLDRLTLRGFVIK